MKENTSTTTARTPFARLADTLDDLSDHGFDVSVDRDNEESFEVSPELPDVSTDVSLEIIREICDDHNVRMAAQENTVIVKKP